MGRLIAIQTWKRGHRQLVKSTARFRNDRYIPLVYVASSHLLLCTRWYPPLYRSTVPLHTLSRNVLRLCPPIAPLLRPQPYYQLTWKIPALRVQQSFSSGSKQALHQNLQYKYSNIRCHGKDQVLQNITPRNRRF